MGRRGPIPKRAATLNDVIEICEPDMPDWLKAEGREIWKRIVPELMRARVPICKLDSTVIGIYCDATARYIAYATICNENGTTYTTSRGIIRERPESKLMWKWLKAATSAGDLIGATTRSRLRLARPADPQPMSTLKSKFFGRESV